MPNEISSVIVSQDPSAIRKSVDTANNLQFGIELWFPLLVAWVLGSFTSLLVSLRDGKPMKAHERFSSALLSGIIAAGTIAYLHESHISAGATISISIVAGLGGDGLVRAASRLCTMAYKKAFGESK